MAKQLQERNEELCMELAAMDKICKNIEKEKRRGDDEVDNQLIALQKQVEGKHQVILELEATNYSLKKVLLKLLILGSVKNISSFNK